jgi:hypothetical protein
VRRVSGIVIRYCDCCEDGGSVRAKLLDHLAAIQACVLQASKRGSDLQVIQESPRVRYTNGMVLGVGFSDQTL